MNYYGDGVVVAFVPARVQLRDEEMASQGEAIERWLDDGGAPEKMSMYDDRTLSVDKEESTCRRRRLHMTTKQYRQFKKRTFPARCTPQKD